MKPYLYTFIREDISPAQQIVQIGHAAYEAGLRFKAPQNETYLILLAAKDESELKEISMRLEGRGIDHHMFYEPDNAMGFSAICTQPVYDKGDRNFFKKYRLYTA